MRDWVREILSRYGQEVTVRLPEGDVVTRAFLQPLTERSEQVPGSVTEIGWVDERLWMYLGQADVEPGDLVLWKETVFRVRSSRPWQVGETPLYCWASLEQEKETAT